MIEGVWTILTAGTAEGYIFGFALLVTLAVFWIIVARFFGL